MNTYRLTISTPDGNRFRDDVTALSLRGTEGDLAVLAGHIPFVTAVKPGECIVTLPDGNERFGKTDGGLLTVGVEETTLLCGAFDWSE